MLYNVNMITQRHRGKPSKIVEAGIFPNQARRLRLERQVTMKEIAEFISNHAKDRCTPQALNQYEKEGIGIDRRKVYALADYFGIDPRILETPCKILPKN